MGNVKRTDIVKFASYDDAAEALNRRTEQHVIMHGDADDQRPYWLVSKRTALRLMAVGYERA